MNYSKNKRICPVERAGSLDNSFRKLLQNPTKILKPYIKNGMTVLDLGCGPGFFSVEIAKMLNHSGKVIAADLQEEMLEKVKRKISGTEIEEIVELHKCESAKIGLIQQVDFVLAFYMIHEVPDQKKLFKELKSILKPGGKIFTVEPKFHVSKKSFGEMLSVLKELDYKIVEMPKLFFSHSVLASV